MRILILGAGAVGGYFGGRLLEKGEDVTFLVRPRRKQQLEESGLVIRSVHGDYKASVKAITSGEDAGTFDAVVLGVKAYHLERSLADLRSYVGEKTLILPLLNGVTHLDRLQEVFKPEQVVGGLCFIETTLNEKGEIEQYSHRHDVYMGELDGSDSERINRLFQVFDGARMTVKKSKCILADMWQKYTFISTFSGITSLMNSSIGPVMAAPGGRETVRRLLDEIVEVARSKEPALDVELAERVFTTLESLEPTMKSSMLRDIEKGGAVEADHLHGSLIHMAPAGTDLPLLKAVYAYLKTYEFHRVIEGARS
ncbi:ketopantoate reductase family protein [Salinithrix halophila]|uniref:2-dehydropantoate 2-reductase n=1 Tax=Salinithrix halophila TaxID=1485204 RepID=A0ABV8JBT7_9BACL